jgi:hypothetical protein
LKDLKLKTIFLNPLFTLLKVSDMPQKPKHLLPDESDESDESGNEKEQYIVNGLFGNEDNASIVRVVLETQDASSSDICDKIIQWRTS